MARACLRIAASCCLLVALAFAVPAAASAATAGDMVRAINAARAENGLAPVHTARSLRRSSARYARVLARRGTFEHARTLRISKFRDIGEILGLCSGTDGAPASIVQAWLGSPVHRPILLNPGYRYVGVGVARGTMNGAMSTFWVVRLGRR